MPRYYFDTFSEPAQPDEVGIELADLGEARAQAVRLAGEMLQYHESPIPDGDLLRVVVSDGGRVPLFTVTVAAATS